MDEEVPVRVHKVDAGPDIFELVLQAAHGRHHCWMKRYHGLIFLSMDAQALDLLESVPAEGHTKARTRLRREASVRPAHLLRMRFSEVDLPEF